MQARTHQNYCLVRPLAGKIVICTNKNKVINEKDLITTFFSATSGQNSTQTFRVPGARFGFRQIQFDFAKFISTSRRWFQFGYIHFGIHSNFAKFISTSRTWFQFGYIHFGIHSNFTKFISISRTWFQLGYIHLNLATCTSTLPNPL